MATPPVFLLENSMDRSLAGYSPWGCKELDMTEYTCTHACITRVSASAHRSFRVRGARGPVACSWGPLAATRAPRKPSSLA